LAIVLDIQNLLPRKTVVSVSRKNPKQKGGNTTNEMNHSTFFVLVQTTQMAQRLPFAPTHSMLL